MKGTSFFAATAVITAFTLAGCAHPPRNYTPQGGDAKLIFRAASLRPTPGIYMGADYSVSTHGIPCEGFERVGVVRDGNKGEIQGKEKLLPWVAKAGEKMLKLESLIEERALGIPAQRQADVPGDAPVQIKGRGDWNGSVWRGSCGPLIGTFVPQKASTYLIELVWDGVAACTVRLSDITAPQQSKPVDLQPHVCPRVG